MKICGVYFCLKDKEIVYIGKTTDILSRVAGHRCVGLNLEYDTVRIIPCNENALDYYEKRWINKFKPKENKSGLGRKKKNTKKLGPPFILRKRMVYRIMTEKSIIGFGRFRDNKVAHLLTEKTIDVVMMYFGLSHISFCEEVLNKLKITNEWRIQKPGTDKEKGRAFLDEIYPELILNRLDKRDLTILKFAKKTLRGLEHASYSKAYNKSINEGH